MLAEGISVSWMMPPSPFTQIQRCFVLPTEFAMSSGEVTPTMKLKRSFIEVKFASVIDGLYDGTCGVNV